MDEAARFNADLVREGGGVKGIGVVGASPTPVEAYAIRPVGGAPGKTPRRSRQA
jgi:hypothetical protein